MILFQTYFGSVREMSNSANASFFLPNDTDVRPNLGKKDKYAREYELLSKEVKRLDTLINEALNKLKVLYRKRLNYSNILINLHDKSGDENKVTGANSSILKKKERLERLSVCSKLLDSKSSLSSLLKSQPLPDLPPPTKQQHGDEFVSTKDSKDSIVSFLRSATPENIVEYINNTGITYLVSLCEEKKYSYPPMEVDISSFIKYGPSAISTIPSNCRRIIIKSLFDALFQKNQVTYSLEDLTTKGDPMEVLTSLEAIMSYITRCKRVKLLLATDTHDELIYVHQGIKNIIPLTSGIIYNTLKMNHFRIINDPNNSEEIDYC